MMKTILRIVNMPARMTSVPKPVALRYVDKDDQGHARICLRTTHCKPQDESVMAVPQRSTLSKNQRQPAAAHQDRG